MGVDLYTAAQSSEGTNPPVQLLQQETYRCSLCQIRGGFRPDRMVHARRDSGEVRHDTCRLAETPCKKPILKIASLFSCMTSLRISDILALCWEDIVDYSAGGKCVHIITQKNKAEDIIPISEEALGLIGYSSEKKGLVFKGLMRSWTQAPMKEWIRSAGITKNITFHSYRRTFATLQAAAGTDIRTIQSIMAHKSITTTQRYIKVVDANKREASKKITLTRNG